MAYEELASIRELVDLTAQEALDRAEAFLTQQGYTVMRRADNSLTVERRPPDRAEGQYAPNLTVSAAPQPGGGVRITVRGNDREGVQERQGAWLEWSENLPKKPEGSTDEAGDQQSNAEVTDVSLPPPPTVESADLSPPPQPTPSHPVAPPPGRESTVWRGTKLAFGGCVVLPVLLLVGFVACVAVLGSGGEEEEGGGGEADSESKSGSSTEEQPTASIGEPVTVGDVQWTVTNATQSSQLRQRGVSKEAAKTERGNFVIVDFDFTNNGSDPVTLDNASLALIDSEGRESNPDSDQFFYVPDDRQLLLENINPGITRQGRTIFEIAPGASGFRLQVGDTEMFTDENGYVDLGF